MGDLHGRFDIRLPSRQSVGDLSANFMRQGVSIGHAFFSPIPSVSAMTMHAQPPLLAVLGMLAAWLCAGCATGPQSAGSAMPPASVAVIVNVETSRSAGSSPDWRSTQNRPDLDEKFAACVASALAAEQLPLRVVNRSSLNAIAYPGIDPRQAPRSVEALGILMNNAEFQERLARAGIRYFAVIGGQTQISDTKGEIGCFGGAPGAAFCLGAVSWDSVSSLSATVVDLVARQQAISAAVQAKDSATFGVALFIPFGRPSFVDELACPRIGAAVAGTLRTLRGQTK